MNGDVAIGAVLSTEAAREVVAALDQLDRLAAPRGMRLSERLTAIRRELVACASRAGTPVTASANDIAGLLLSESNLMSVDTATAAENLGITTDGVRWLCRRGHLTAVRLRGRWLIEPGSLQTYVAIRDRTR